MSNNRNIFAAVSYITWIGFLITMVAADRSDRLIEHHLNQALVLNLASIVAGLLRVIPVVGGLAFDIISLVLLVLAIMGIYRAITGSTRPLPLIGDIHLIG